MVLIIGSAEVAPGRMQEAQEWGRRFVAHLKKAFNVTAHLTQPVNAPPGQGARLGTVEMYESLAVWASVADRVPEDRETVALIREAYEEKQYFLRNTLTRTLQRVI